jgi:hypothetical protein
MQRLIVRVLLSLLIYNTSAWLVGRTARVVAYLLGDWGAPDAWKVFQGFLFTRSIAIGILAGLVPLQLWLTVSGLVRAEVPEFLKKLELEQMKPWIVVMYSPILALTLWVWLIDWSAMRSRGLGVLQTSSSVPIWQMFDGFFESNCQNVIDNRLSLWTDNFAYQCSIHVLWVSSFMIAVGYSFAPLIRSRFPKGASAEDLTPEETVQEQAEPKNSAMSNEQTQ